MFVYSVSIVHAFANIDQSLILDVIVSTRIYFVAGTISTSRSLAAQTDQLRLSIRVVLPDLSNLAALLGLMHQLNLSTLVAPLGLLALLPLVGLQVLAPPLGFVYRNGCEKPHCSSRC